MKEIVSFFLSGKKYAVEVSHMQGIEKPRKMNQPPDMPDFLEGVVDIRGEMIPVMAIRKKLTLPAAEKTEKTKFLVFPTKQGKMACIVDGISRILKIDDNNVQAFPPIIQNAGTGYADFVARYEGELILVINPDNLLSEEDWKTVHEMLDRMEEEEEND